MLALSHWECVHFLSMHTHVEEAYGDRGLGTQLSVKCVDVIGE